MTNSLLISKHRYVNSLLTKGQKNHQKNKAGKMSLYEWTVLKRSMIVPDRLLDFNSHKYLVGIYQELAGKVVVKKSSQLGLSEWLVSYAIHACDQKRATVMYVFPTERGIYDFSSARFGPAIEASPYLQSIVVDGRGGNDGKHGAARTTLKRIKNRFLYLRGGQVGLDGNAPQLKSVDADIIIIDEVDECDQRAVTIAQKRLGHSQIAEERLVSTPTFPGRGIDSYWVDSDQREWLIPCPACNHWQQITIHHIVTEFDDLERPVTWHGQAEDRAFAACENCGRELDRLAPGRWVPRYPGREVVGYHPTKFASPITNLLQIVKNLDTVDETKRREATNQDLGETYTPRGGQLTDELLDECRRDYGPGPRPGTGLYAGADVGKVIHVVIRTGPDSLKGETEQTFAGEVESFEELGRLMKRFKVKKMVIDALPETRKCRELQGDFETGLVWLAYYADDTKWDKSANWDEDKGIVNLDRTRSLDEMFTGFYDIKSTLLGNARDIKDYYDHMKAPVRILKKNHKGVQVARYVESGPDHFSHAENYCRVAMNAPVVQSVTVSRSVRV